VPIVAMLCLRATGTSSIDGVGFIRAKESDRLGDLAREVVKLGGRIEVLPDGLEIQGVDSLNGQAMNTYDDHRLAMAFAVLGTVVSGISVNDSAVVSKSWPSFWLDMTQVLG
jgi:3-phosphoshikimate 1-carboxyvinyltransferase